MRKNKKKMWIAVAAVIVLSVAGVGLGLYLSANATLVAGTSEITRQRAEGEFPEIILTEEELSAIKTLLRADRVRMAMANGTDANNQGGSSVVNLPLEEAAELLKNMLPEGAHITDYAVAGNTAGVGYALDAAQKTVYYVCQQTEETIFIQKSVRVQKRPTDPTPKIYINNNNETFEKATYSTRFFYEGAEKYG